MSEWISVKDRLPDAGVYKEFIVTNHEEYACAYMSCYGWGPCGVEPTYDMSGIVLSFEPTHWKEIVL